ncbi:hypothetical protein ACOMHN_007137 [Nucella lapillus]
MSVLQDVSSLKTIWTAMSGQVHAPPLVGSCLIYSIAFFTCLLAQQVCKRFLPPSLYSYAADFFCALVICSFPYGHGAVRANYGQAGYVIAAVTMVTVSISVFEGVASPLGVFVRYLRGEESLWGLSLRVVLQVVAAFLSYRLVFLVCCLELTKDHQAMLAGTCVSDLKVPVFLGCLIEFSSVVYDTWLCHQRLFRAPLLDMLAKNVNGALLVCAGVNLTGMYMHPALATAMTFNCKGTDTFEHIFVYWVATFLGCFAGVQLDSVLRLPSTDDAAVAKKKKDSIGYGDGDKKQNLRTTNGDVKERKKERKLAAGEKMPYINNNNNNNNKIKSRQAKKQKKDN